MHKRILILAVFLFCCGCATLQDVPPQFWQQAKALEPFKKGERVLILAPHPDDETIGAAGIIQQAKAAGARVKVLYLTNGDHNELAFIVYEKRITMRQGEFVHMGQVRRKEAIRAMRLLGLDENDLIFLGYPDFGTFNIFSQYWQAKKPFRDKLTRISSVPYKENFSYGAPYQGESILSDIEKVLLDYKPHKIFSSHPADVNVDHKTFYLFLQVALSDLQGQILEPKVYPYLVHCLDWPAPRHYHPQLPLYPPRKFIFSKNDWLLAALSGQEVQNKRQAVLCYRSQTQSSAFYLLAFCRKNELFWDYPQIRLQNQEALKDRVVSFFGHADLFNADSDTQASIAGDKKAVSYAVADGYLFVRLDSSAKLSRRFGVLLYIFGYSSKTNFARMPKVKIITKGNFFKFFDGKRRLSPEGASLQLTRNTMLLKIPLKALGDPDYLLSALRSYNATVPVEAMGFRKVIIK